MPINSHILYEGAVVRTFYRNGTSHTAFSIMPIYFVAEQDADSITLRQALLRRYHQLEALYTPQRFTDSALKIGQKDEIIPLEIFPVTDHKKIANLEKRL